MKKIFGMLFILLLTFSLAACGSSSSSTGGGASDDPIVMKIGHTMVEDSTRNAGAAAIKEYVEAESDGRIKVEIYPNSQLGNSKEQVEGLQTGSIQMTIFPTTSLSDFSPIFTLPDIPFLFPTDQEKMLKLYETEAFKKFMEAGDDVGIKVLAPWFEGFGTITSKDPVTTIDDFDSQKFRIIGGDILKKYYTDLGSETNVIAFSEVYTSLQTGRISTIDIPIHQVFDNKFYEVAGNITNTNHWALHDFVMVNKNWYDSLPSDLQEIIADASVAAAPLAVEKLNELTDNARNEMIDAGVEFHEPSEEFINEMKAKNTDLEEMYIELSGDKGKEILNGIKQAIEELE